MESEDIGEAIKIDQYSEHYLSDQGELIANIIDNAAIILKAVHSDSFSSGSLKVKMFII